MATTQGIREKVHLPIYDSLTVEPGKQPRDIETSHILTLFAHARDKTKLETNAALLSRFTRFEAIAMQVVISDLPPELSSDGTVAADNSPRHLITRLTYNTVTTLFVGEKTIIQMPTWFFRGGAGTHSDATNVSNHGEPSPTAVFRFAEPIVIDKQQNFRVEIEATHADFMTGTQRMYGRLLIWVVLDGYMIRDVPGAESKRNARPGRRDRRQRTPRPRSVPSKAKGRS